LFDAHRTKDTDMDSIEVLAAILIWLLVVGAALTRVPGGGVRSLIAPWLALTLLTMAVEFIVLFIATYGLLFFVSKEAAMVGVVISVIILAATPVAWALVLRKRAHEAAAHKSTAAHNGAAAGS
jgi:hypothetical protein